MQFFERDENFSWRVLAVESAVIMLSVLLGFMLNGWRQSQTQQSNVDIALKSIASEMRYNKQEIERHLPKYRSIANTMDSLALVKGGNESFDRNKLNKFAGYDIPALRSSAFEAARSTGVLSQVEFELAQELYAYYRLQNIYQGMLEKLSTGFIMDNYKTINDWWWVFMIMAENGEFIHNTRFVDVRTHLLGEYNLAVIEDDSTAGS